jgi:hypothetical protein
VTPFDGNLRPKESQSSGTNRPLTWLFIEGLHRTIDWYFSTKDREQVRAMLDRMLTER